MRASIYVGGVLLAALICATTPADAAVESLYAQQNYLFDELLADEQTPEQELVEVISPADMNADNGTPINVDPKQVHEEVDRFVQYEFSVALKKCTGTDANKIVITGIKTSVAEGINYDVEFTHSGKSYSIEVVRTPQGNPKELPGEEEVVRDEFRIFNGFQPPVCSNEASWTATEYADFTGLSMKQFAKKFTGDKAPAATDFIEEDKELSEAEAAKLPASFDWRKHMGDSQGMKVQSQGECSACYATAAASVMSDRLFIASKGRINVDVSAQSLMDCSKGCEGGTANDAFKAMMDPKKAPPTWCAPYTGKAGKCGDTCGKATEYSVVANGDKKVATLGIAGKGKETAIMFQLYHYGPVYMRMQVYNDFPYYRSGVYKHQSSAQVRGDHAVKLVGYGMEGSLKYWIAQNSWGEKWGEKGFFRIARGEDESGVESRGVFWAIPEFDDVCPKAPACNNGGSFTSSCGCHCSAGFTGATCDMCNKQCGGEGFTGKLEHDKCACECAPGYFDGEQDGVFTKCGLKLGGTEKVEHHDIAVPPCADSAEECPNWANKGFCDSKSKYVDYTVAHCDKSCDLCDSKKSAAIPVSVEGHLSYQYGDMVVAVPKGKSPWNIKRGWTPNSAYSFVCGPETDFEESLFCEDHNSLTIKIPTPGMYDVFFYKFLGNNAFGQSRGWDVHPKKLAIGACAGKDTKCDLPSAPPGPPKALNEKQKAEVAQRVADAALSASKRAKESLEKAQAKVNRVEKEAQKKMLKASKLAKSAELKKEHAEMMAKVKARKAEAKELTKKTMVKTAKDMAAAKEIDSKRTMEKKKSQVADEKRHEVVLAIQGHKKVLDRLGKIAATLATEEAHVEATSKEASHAEQFRQDLAQAKQNTKDAKGMMKAQMRKAAKLAQAAAAAQDTVKQDSIKEKVAEQRELQETTKSKAANKAYAINAEYKKKFDATTALHLKWQQKSLEAEKDVTTAKDVAVKAMESAQCIIKDHRSGCSTKGWKNHCQTKKWKAWMMTHCTESCGFSCSDLHSLAMGIILKAEDKARAEQEKARKEACPKYNDITERARIDADSNGKMATTYEQQCNMRNDEGACKSMNQLLKVSVKFEQQHKLYKLKMQKLGCYEYHGQWATGKGAADGSAAGQKLLRLEPGSNEISGGQGPSSEGPTGPTDKTNGPGK